MSYYLLRLELGKFGHSLPEYYNYIGYESSLPKTYQEAMLLFYLSTNTPYEKYKTVIEKNTLDRFSQFNNILLTKNMNFDLAKNDLEKDFSDTYWYYLRYTSPKVTGLKVKKKNL
jgi:hypothetical protein